MCNRVKTAVAFLDDCPKFSRRRYVTLASVEKILELLHSTGQFLAEAWNRGLDAPDARRQLESRARRIFIAIMTDRCGQCLAPITACRQAH
jgi:hypothetical protein